MTGIVGLLHAQIVPQWTMPFAGLWRVPESPLDRRYPDSGNEPKRVLGVLRCPTGRLIARRASKEDNRPHWSVV